MTTPNRVEEFIAYCVHDRMRSPHTVRRYRATLRTLARVADPATATKADIERWWDSRIDIEPGRPRSAASRSNELASLRSFYRFMVRRGYRPDDPTAQQDFVPVPNRLPRMIGRTDLERLLGPLTADAPDLRRAVALGAFAGMRVSEVAAQDWADIDLEHRRIYVRGKGLWERPIGLSTVLMDYLLPDTGGNVVAAGGDPYSGATLQRKINRLMERNGIDRRFHDLRKRGASVLLSKGANPAAVRVMFGWRSMETVTHYAVVGDEELDRLAEMIL
jgi:site-specific recombinase XerD